MTNNVSRRQFVELSGLVAAGLGLVGCGGGSASSSSDSIKVGIMGPFSGDVAQYGIACRNGAQLYFKQLNEKGGVNGKQIDMDVQDDLFPEERSVKTKAHDTPPAKNEVGSRVTNSRVSSGCRIYGNVSDSILGRDVIVEPGATVRSAIIMQGCVIKTGARVENAIVDRNNVVSAGTELRGTPEDVLVKEKPSE